MRGNGGNKKGLNALSKVVKDIRIKRKIESETSAQAQLVSLTFTGCFYFHSFEFLAPFQPISSRPIILPRAFNIQEAPGSAVSSS